MDRKRKVFREAVLAFATFVVLAASAAAQNHWLSGTPDGLGQIAVDDDLDVYVNGGIIFSDGTVAAGLRPPIAFNGNIGDTLRIVVRDTYGGCASLSKIYLTDSGGRSRVIDHGFDLGCGRGSGNQGVVHDLSVPIPDLTQPPSPLTHRPAPGQPVYGLTPGPNGLLYGVTTTGGLLDRGTLFSVTPNLDTLIVLHSFGTSEALGPPDSELLLGTGAAGGKLFGTTCTGGSANAGTVYAFDLTTNTVATLASFTNNEPHCPSGPLVQIGNDLYGTTALGALGTNYTGNAVIRVPIAGGGYQIVRSLVQVEGHNLGGLLLGTDGWLHGTAYGGGDPNCNPSYGGCGTLFSLLPGGSTFTVDHVFGPQAPDGLPNRGLVEIGGNFYGTFMKGVFRDGASYEEIHRITSSGVILTPPSLGDDGRLYGVTYNGGDDQWGTLFSLLPDGTGHRIEWEFTEDGPGLAVGRPYRSPGGAIFGTTEYTSSTPDTGAIYRLDVDTANQAPVANAQSLTTPEDADLSITLTGSDADGDLLTYQVVSPPAHGQLTGAAPNLSYKPDGNYHGTDAFTFTVNDGTVTSAAATVSINIMPVNDVPVANAQSLTTPEDVDLSITLTGSDADGDPLTYQVVSAPVHGQLTGAAPNLSYKPAGNYHGTDAFTFTVNDGTVTSAAATVSINITPVNDVPVAVADTAATTAPSPVTIAVLANDSDVDGDVLAVSSVGPAQGGTVVIDAGGTITYTPNRRFTGVDIFNYTVSDGNGGVATATVTVTVTGANTPPRARNDNARTSGAPIVIDVLANDSDADGDTLTVAGVSPSPGNMVSISADGKTVLFAPGPGATGNQVFTYTVSDGRGGTDTANVRVQVR